MVQPLRSDARTLDKPVSFRVTQAERDAIDRCAAQLGIPGLGGEAPEAGVRRAKAYRDLAAAAVTGVIVADMTDADRAKLDRLVAAQSTTLARYAMTATRSSVLLSLLREAPEHDAAPPALDVKALVAAAPVVEAAVREAAAREAAAVTPAPAEHEAPAPPAELPPPAELQAALDLAHEAGEMDELASAIGVKSNTLRSFRSRGTGIGYEKLQKLVPLLRAKGHLKDA